MTNKTTEWQFGDYIGDWERNHPMPQSVRRIRQAVRDHERGLLYEFCAWRDNEGYGADDSDIKEFLARREVRDEQ